LQFVKNKFGGFLPEFVIAGADKGGYWKIEGIVYQNPAYWGKVITKFQQ